MTRQEEIREELRKRYRYTFCFLCSLQGWHTSDMVPDGIMKEAERCEDAFVDGWLEYLHSQDVVIKGKYYFQSDLYAVEPLIEDKSEHSPESSYHHRKNILGVK